MKAWPIQLRITLGFTVAMALVLSMVGPVAYGRLTTGLSDDLNRELKQRVQDLTGPVSRPGSSLTDLAGTGFVERGESFAEVVTTDGRVLQATETLHGQPLLSAAEAARAADGSVFFDRRQAPGLNEPARLLAAAEEVDRLIRLSEDLLLLASSDDAGLRIARQQVDVASLLTGVASRFRTLAARSGRAITVQTGDVQYVEADAQRLEQALSNLVSNAFQHGAGEIGLSARAAGGETEFLVTDTGEGFSAAMLAHGFERFAHNSSMGGSGLGLSIVAAVAKAHGGSAGLCNPPTGGSAVWIRLPTSAYLP